KDNDKLCQRELSAAGEVLGAFLGDRLNEVEEKCEQSLIKIDRGRRFWGSFCLSWFNCQYMNASMLYAPIKRCLKSTALSPQHGPHGRCHHTPHHVQGHGHAPLFLREGLKKDGLGQGDQAAPAEALEHTPKDHHLQGTRKATQHRGGNKEDQGQGIKPLA